MPQHCHLDPKLLGDPMLHLLKSLLSNQREQEHQAIFPHCILEHPIQAQLTVNVARLVCLLAIFRPSEGHQTGVG